MSEIHPHPLPDAYVIGEQASQWLERQERGTWSTDDQEKFESWLAQSMAHRTAYWRVKAAWNRADRLGAFAPRFGITSTKVAPSRSPAFGWKRIAATGVVAAIAGAGALLLSPRPPQDSTFATTVGGRKVIALTDGSTIELNTDTIIRLDAANHRKVWLDKGEAYFDIKHDASHPFTVMADGHRVTDLGTKFYIREDASRLEVGLIEGRASVTSISGRIKPQILTPGHVAIATADLTSITKKPVNTLSNDLGWRNGLLIFRGMTLADAASEFNRYNLKKIVVSDPAAAGLKLDGTFPANNVEAFLDAVESALKVHVVDQGNEAVITR